LALARRRLELAHQRGDPRLAGQALAALARWQDHATAPAEVLLTRATIQQYLHDFDGALLTLRQLTARADGARLAQAWLTMATILRLQGSYADSDAACRQVAAAGAPLYSTACLAENDGLRGRTAPARQALAGLLADPGLATATAAWLYTSLAELEARDGRDRAADAAFRQALALGADDYTRISYADFLLDQQRPGAALQVLAGQPHSDAVLLRLAIAGTRAAAPGAAAAVNELRERIALSNQRADARLLHGREQAMFALAIDGAAASAVTLARGNLTRQREALDLLLAARAARAAGDRQASAQVRQLQQKMGLHDRRLDALF
ncbi:hypothetical protein, partial [Duganella alba]